jgi:V-type H+-transporting ATPase subunit a
LNRSEDIELYKLSIHKDHDWKIMNELGKLGQLHFIDLNKDQPPYALPYTQDIKRLEEAERKLQ